MARRGESAAIHVRRPDGDLEPGQAAAADRPGPTALRPVLARRPCGARAGRAGLHRRGRPGHPADARGGNTPLPARSSVLRRRPQVRRDLPHHHPSEGITPTVDRFQPLLQQGVISDRQYCGLLRVRKRSTIARREYVALTAVSERSVAADLADLLRKGQLESTGERGRMAAYG